MWVQAEDGHSSRSPDANLSASFAEASQSDEESEHHSPLVSQKSTHKECSDFSEVSMSPGQSTAHEQKDSLAAQLAGMEAEWEGMV